MGHLPDTEGRRATQDSERFGKHLPASVLEGAWGHFQSTHPKGARPARPAVVLHPCAAPGLNNGSASGCARAAAAPTPRSLGLAWGSGPDEVANATAGTVCDKGVNCGLDNYHAVDPLFLSPDLNKYRNADGQVCTRGPLGAPSTTHTPNPLRILAAASRER